METIIYKISEKITYEDMTIIEKAANYIKEEKLVCFPTETVYGLGGNGLSPKACNMIFKTKGRPTDNPLILHVCDIQMAEKLCTDIPDDAKKLMENLWPGPLTIVLGKSEIVPDEATAGGSTVGIRLPRNKIAKELIKRSGIPIAAPSANISGRPSPTNGQDAMADLKGKIPMILDGGQCEIGIESTVIDMTEKPYTILRPGFYDAQDLIDYIGEVQYDKHIVEEGVIPKSPGQKYRHYAPKANVEIFIGDSNGYYREINETICDHKKNGKKVGVIAFKDSIDNIIGYDKLLVMEFRGNLENMAKNIFQFLRQMDRFGVDEIIVEGTMETGLGIGIMNRLKKASQGRIRVF